MPSVLRKGSNKMKRLGWGLIGSALIVTFNVSATVTPSCGVVSDNVRCIGTGVTDEPISQPRASIPSADHPKSTRGRENGISHPVSSLRAAAPLPASADVINDESYDDGCE